ncbi:MAG TPA: NrfD/PsrC family molybdoenzyme membrane anchor subunit [Planctomycetota bacterium]|nr:NrfD/PsrC family molybdoenzyme membrane anchor subunit [Planctomycetota bacterium]
MNSTSNLVKASAWTALVSVTAAGLAAIVVRLWEGLGVTNMTQHVPWGLWIALYIYLIGLSAGSFLLSTLVYVFGVRRFEPVGPLALLQALICMLLAIVLILLDLGHPERFLHVFIYWNPTSVLAWECLFYTAYIAIIVTELYLVFGRPASARKWLRILGLIGIPVAVGVHGGTGAIFAVVKSRPTWYTGLLPIIFLVSAVVSGGALLTFLSAAVLPSDRDRKLPIIRTLATITAATVALDLLLLASEVLVTFYGGMSSHVAAWKSILFGPYAWVFWGVQIALGALIPMLIVAHPRARASIAWLGAAGVLVVVGVVGVRLNIVIPPLIEPEFAALPAAYQHERFATGYFPSLNEWLVSMGVVALGVWGFAAGLRWLPIRGAAAAGEGELT